MEKRKNWVDYKELKASVTIEMLLDRYGLLSELKKSGQNLAGCCPIHRGSNPRQFSVNPDKNIWNCFGNCKTGGNILDFVAMMEFENKEPESVRKAALLLKQWFMFDSTTGGPDPDTKTEPVRKEVEQETAAQVHHQRHLLRQGSDLPEQVQKSEIQHLGRRDRRQR